MKIFENVISKWIKRKKNSDLERVRVTSGGTFYMKSQDIFNDKVESLEFLKKLDQSIELHNINSNKRLAQSE